MKHYYKNDNPTWAGLIGCGLLFIVGVMAYLLVLGLIFQVLWNLVVPSVVGGSVLEYPQAFAIVVLLSIVGSFFRSTVSKS